MPPSDRLQAPVASHADMLAILLGRELTMSEYYYSAHKEIFDGFCVKTTEESHFPDYPRDVLFNAFFARGSLYCKRSSVSCAVLSYAQERGYKVVDVKQGYAKCSVALMPNGCITSDTSLCRALRENGENVLMIPQGGVRLCGYEYGFIGGASFYCDGRLYFFGDAKRLEDWDKIKRFCAEINAEAVMLTDSELTDVGGAIVL